MKLLTKLLYLLGIAVLANGALAQSYPDKLIRLVVPYSPGSSTDNLARILAQRISVNAKQPVIVENKAGANGFLGVQAVQTAPPDGYTVLVTTSSTQVINRFLFKNLPYDPVKDFAPVATLGRGWLIMVVRPNFPATTVRQFIDLAKKQPGKLSFASGTAVTRFAGEMLQQIGRVQLLNVPYKSIPPAINDLLGGQVDTLLTDGGTILPHVRAGKLRALGVTSHTRLPGLPDLPTIEEQGLPGYEMSFWSAAYVPAGTPPAIIGRLNELFAKATQDPTAAAFFASSSNERFIGTPEDLAKFEAAETEKWRAIIKASGVEAE